MSYKFQVIRTFSFGQPLYIAKRSFYFELKKIVHKRVNQIAMLSGLLTMILANGLGLVHSASYTADSIEYTDAEAILKQAETCFI